MKLTTTVRSTEESEYIDSDNWEQVDQVVTDGIESRVFKSTNPLRNALYRSIEVLYAFLPLAIAVISSYYLFTDLTISIVFTVLILGTLLALLQLKPIQSLVVKSTYLFKPILYRVERYEE